MRLEKKDIGELLEMIFSELANLGFRAISGEFVTTDLKLSFEGEIGVWENSEKEERVVDGSILVERRGYVVRKAGSGEVISKVEWDPERRKYLYELIVAIADQLSDGYMVDGTITEG